MVVGMDLKEFLMQYDYCKEHNTPEGYGCEGCLGNNRVYCADALVKHGEDVLVVYDPKYKRVRKLVKD